MHAPKDGTNSGALRCAQDTPSAQSVIPAELVLVETGSGNPEQSPGGHAPSWPQLRSTWTCRWVSLRSTHPTQLRRGR
jgi:hypothetical protein